VSPEIAKIVEWIQTLHPELTGIDHDLDLIESRTIDSLAFAEFLIRVEQLARVRIDMETVDLEDFRTLRGLERAFFSGVPVERRAS
jgi:acyl carrier protein